jgi:hypothetical protein
MAFEGYSERGTGGQERGPGTFSFAPPGTPQASANEQAVGTRAGNVNPQASQQALTYQSPPPDKTFEAVIGFADKAFGEKLNEIKQEQFLRGMQQAASGEALTDIVNEQPWFTRIFGPSGAADGARAYTVAAKVADWGNQQELDMQELRKVSPDQIPAYLNKAVNDRKTGDLTTDVMMGMQIMKEAPGLMKRHARENYKYQQEEAVKARYTAMSAAAVSVQLAGAADEGTVLPEEVEERVGRLYQALVLKPGEDPESQRATLKTFVQAQAAEGNFHVINRLEQDGILGDLKPEDQAAMTKYIRASRLQQASDAGELYADQIFKVSASARLGKISANEVRIAHDAINAENSRLTGNPMPVVRKPTVLSDQWSAMQYLKAADEQAAKAALKIDLEEQTKAGLKNYLATGGTQQGALNAKYDSHDLQLAFKERFDAAPTLEAKAAILAADAVGGMPNKFLKEDFSRIILSGPTDRVNDDFLRTHAQWKALNKANGHEAVAMYFPGDTDRLMAEFNTALGGRDPLTHGDAAWQEARAKHRATTGVQYAKGEDKLAEQAVRKALVDQGGWFFGGDKLTKSSMQALLNGMAADWMGNKRSLNADLVPTRTLANARANGWEIAGNYAWHVDPNRPRLDSYFPTKEGQPVLTAKEQGQGLNAAVEAKLKEVTDKSPDDVRLYRVSDDTGGNAVFQAMVQVGEDTPYILQFTSQDILEQAKKIRLAPAVRAERQGAETTRRKALQQQPGNALSNPRFGNTRGPSDFRTID